VSLLPSPVGTLSNFQPSDCEIVGRSLGTSSEMAVVSRSRSHEPASALVMEVAAERQEDWSPPLSA
jgi:hypothetical protein